MYPVSIWRNTLENLNTDTICGKLQNSCFPAFWLLFRLASRHGGKERVKGRFIALRWIEFGEAFNLLFFARLFEA